MDSLGARFASGGGGGAFRPGGTIAWRRFPMPRVNIARRKRPWGAIVWNHPIHPKVAFPRYGILPRICGAQASAYSRKDPPSGTCPAPRAFVQKCGQTPFKPFEWIGATPSSPPHFHLPLGGPGSISNRKRVIGCLARLLPLGSGRRCLSPRVHAIAPGRPWAWRS